MNITVVTVGTRGDVQPLAAMALGLRGRGHEVRFCTGSLHRDWILARGLEWAPADCSLLEQGDANRLRDRMASNNRLVELLRHSRAIVSQLRESIARLLDSALEAARDADAVVCRLPLTAARYLSDHLEVPCFQVELTPLFTPTREFPSYMLPNLSLGPWYNRLSYYAFRVSTWPIAAAVDAWARKSLGHPGRPVLRDLLRTDPTPVHFLYAFSPQLVPRPSDWPAHSRMTGFCFLDEPAEWKPPEDLERFLDRGPAPIYFGFGSMARHAERVTESVLRAIEQSGRRALLATGRGGLCPRRIPAGAMVVSDVPHSWLFPRVAAVFHHGGVGTTAAGLRAGVPSVLCPFHSDQFFWGRRVQELGLGPRCIPQSRLTTKRLAEAIDLVVSDASFGRRAADFGRGLRAENGLSQTLDAIEGAIAAPIAGSSNNDSYQEPVHDRNGSKTCHR